MTKQPKEKLPIHPQQRVMIEEFQCPGCLLGVNIECGAFKLEQHIAGTPAFHCAAHVAGTTAFPGGRLALGLPKGFNKVGALPEGMTTNIRLWHDLNIPLWNSLNVPVWAMKKDGYTFVRTYSPRINLAWVDVIENGPEVAFLNTSCRDDVTPTASTAPLHAIDVGCFIDEID